MDRIYMETDRIYMETDSDISCIHLSVSFSYDGNRSDTHGNGFRYLGYPFSCFLTVSIPQTAEYSILCMDGWTQLGLGVL